MHYRRQVNDFKLYLSQSYIFIINTLKKVNHEASVTIKNDSKTVFPVLNNSSIKTVPIHDYLDVIIITKSVRKRRKFEFQQQTDIYK